MLIRAPRAINKIQSVNFAWTWTNNQAAGGANVNRTISPVDTSRSIILLHESSIGPGGGTGNIYIRLTSGTNAQLHHESNDAAQPQTVKAYVVELKPGILKSLQVVSGTTISSVNISKSIFVPASFYASGSNVLGPCGASITSATSISWKTYLTWCTTYGQVVEFR